MKNLLLLLLIGASWFKTQAQTDTLYQDANRKPTSKDNALYTLILTKKDDLTQCLKYKYDTLLLSDIYYSIYADNIKHGPCIIYYSDGKIKQNLHYKQNKLHGIIETYHENGIVKRQDTFENGMSKNGRCFTATGADTAYYPFFISASHIGGLEALYAEIAQKVIYPKEARRKEIEGRVTVQFVVNTDGKLEDIEILKGVHPLLDEEALRVTKLFNKWAPAYEDGNLVKVRYALPFNFNLK
jgi:TonB family protein